jgi:hypothetical protein
MVKADSDKIKIIIHRIGLKYHLQDEDIRKIITSPYIFTRETITNLDIENNTSEEDFNNLKTNFIFPKLGKLYVRYQTVLRYQNKKNNNNK